MLPVTLVSFLAARGYANLSAWFRAAGVPPQVAWQARAGRGLAERHAVKLAKLVGESPATVRALITMKGDAR